MARAPKIDRSAPGLQRRPALKLKEVEAALRASAGIRSVAAARLKVNPSSITRFIAKHPQLEEIEAEIVDGIVDLAVGKLVEQIRNGEFPAIKYYLDNKGQAAGFGVRKLAFSDGDGNVMLPGVLVAPIRELDADQWAARHKPPEG
ncbi:hypothetical protein [Sphingomonas sp. HMP6]|uniref:hypothetical protein n=1 Tax=Sphingomonas sp. HMP6 TaxID=1517551 RepID=UPI001596D50C|nr:hypothetical protein [Sphingomonas sp. HMP6]BCA57694.1 hypothetical protein HMP06_0463 [Sphingomonas sp. HMP6]